MLSLHFIATYRLTGISLVLPLYARATYDLTVISLNAFAPCYSHLQPDRNLINAFPLC